MEQLADRVYVETEYQGVNVGAIVTKQGVIAIDAPSYPRQAREWATKLHRLNHQAVQFVILTDSHGDRIINTRWFNAPIVTHQETAEKLISYDKRFPQPLLDSLIARFPESGRDLNTTPVERATLMFTGTLSLMGNVPIELIAAPGPTSGNIWVHLPNQKILFVGDTITTNGPPFLTEGSCQQWLQTLEQLQRWSPEKIIHIVPGRGAVTDYTAIQSMHNYLQEMWMCIHSHVAANRPKEETAVYLPRFLSLLPANNLPTDWVQRQLKLSLDRVYDEVQLTVR